MDRARAAGSPGAGAQVSHDRHLAASPAGPAASGPVIVLSSAYFGAGWLRLLLDGHPDLACTSGTGILPLCEQAMAAWRSADGQAARSPSPLAVTATRALASSIITAVLAREGKRRWCEIATANAGAAETFLRLYPQTKFVCLYRACPEVIRAILDASPWGIADAAFAPFTKAYPASTTAALTAYWLARTQTLLTFERAHPQACLRVRFEDLAANRHKTAGRMTSFLGITCLDHQTMPAIDNQNPPEPGTPFPAPEFPADLIPPMMLAHANDLLQQLGYPSLPPAPAADSSSPLRGGPGWDASPP
jgi:hypothetical protein